MIDPGNEGIFHLSIRGVEPAHGQPLFLHPLSQRLVGIYSLKACQNVIATCSPSIVWHYGTLYLFSGKSFEEMYKKKDPGNGTQSAIVPYIFLVPPLVGHHGHHFRFFRKNPTRKVYRKNVVLSAIPASIFCRGLP